MASYAVIHQNNQLLLCRLSSSITSQVGYWTLPRGGWNCGESPEENMIREVEEETDGTADFCQWMSFPSEEEIKLRGYLAKALSNRECIKPLKQQKGDNASLLLYTFDFHQRINRSARFEIAQYQGGR